MVSDNEDVQPQIELASSDEEGIIDIPREDIGLTGTSRTEPTIEKENVIRRIRDAQNTFYS